MERVVTFQNTGILDTVSIGTFGINVKDNESAIGYFGTGLKYAIAVLLREGCAIGIHAGDAFHFFTVQETDVRGKTFQVVCMNGVQLGFTTELGKNWELWQAFRELYCNALDEEGGAVFGNHCDHINDGTTITVTGEKFYSCYLDRASVVLPDTNLMFSDDKGEVHRGSSHYVFYKGVRIYDGLGHSMFTYNLLRGVDITEDRTAKYEHHVLWGIAHLITNSTDHDFISKALLAPRNTLEAEIDLSSSSSNTVSDVFLDVAEGLRLNPAVNRSVRKVLAKYNRMPPPKETVLDEIQVMMLARAVKFCKQLGYPVDLYPIVTSSDLKSGFEGLAKDSTIYLSPDVFGKGTKYLAATLIEEYLHIFTGYGDMTRELQNLLFDAIVSLGERIIGEPV